MTNGGRPALVCQLPKLGARFSDTEDAVALSTRARRYAVADGAAFSSYGGVWARLLVGQFVRGAPARWTADDVSEWLAPSRRRWRRRVPWNRLDRFARRHALQGGFATLLGLELDAVHPCGVITWRALAVGDACLFQVRDRRVLLSFPLTRSEEFAQPPSLLATDPSLDDDLPRTLSVAEGAAERSDLFVLCSDAVARYLISDGEALPWLLAAYDEDAAAGRCGAVMETLEAARHCGALRDDDLTLLITTAA